jgi:predicted nucleic acid-binding protein
MLADSYQNLGARDLIHLAVCRRHSIGEIKTFERGLAAAFRR